MKREVPRRKNDDHTVRLGALAGFAGVRADQFALELGGCVLVCPYL